ncbi:hypothetical protein KC357_g8975 [Hortaea werneckii]|nr:hypothetical protein KC357_g8975 [Hortaea werneckii]
MCSNTREFEYDHRERARCKGAAGRKIVRWDPGLDQLVLLCVKYVCTKDVIEIPWDEVAELYREIDGQKVPPRLSANRRRKPFKIFGNSDDAAPTAKENKKGSSGDTDKDRTSAGSVKPSDSLVFGKMGSIGKKSSQSNQGATTETSAASRGHKPFPPPLKITSTAKGVQDNAEDEWLPTVGRGTKRRSKYIDMSDDNESTVSTPTKHQKTSRARNFRNVLSLDYSKQLGQSEDDGNDMGEEDEAARTYDLAQQYESPVRNNSFYEERSQGFNPDGIVIPPMRAQSGHGFGINATFDGQPVNGPGGVAGFRGYNDCTNTPSSHFPTSNNFFTASYLPPHAFKNSKENPLMSDFENDTSFRGGKNYNMSGAMNFGRNRAINNEIVNNLDHMKDMRVLNNGIFANGVPQIFTQKNQGGFNANATKEGDAETSFSSFPAYMAGGNICIPPAMTQDPSIPKPAKQFVDSSEISRIDNSHDGGACDSQANGNDSHDHDVDFDSFLHECAFEADPIFDTFGTGDEHSMFHPISGIHEKA